MHASITLNCAHKFSMAICGFIWFERSIKSGSQYTLKRKCTRQNHFVCASRSQHNTGKDATLARAYIVNQASGLQALVIAVCNRLSTIFLAFFNLMTSLPEHVPISSYIVLVSFIRPVLISCSHSSSGIWGICVDDIHSPTGTLFSLHYNGMISSIYLVSLSLGL